MTISQVGNGILKALARVLSPFNGLITLDIRDAKVFEGIAYFVRTRHTIAASGTLNIIVDPTAFVGTAVVYRPIIFDCIGGSLNVDIYRGATANDDGTVVNPKNADLNITANGALIYRENPTGIVAGSDLIMSLFVPSNGTGVVASSGVTGSGSELVTNLDTLKKYLVRITNNSATDSAYIGIKADHFEVV